MDEDSHRLTAVCYVRAPMLVEPIDSQVDTLRTCESAGAIDDLLLRSWPDEVTLDEDTPHREVVDDFERFERWADREGVRIRPPFQVRTSAPPLSSEPRDVLMTPLLCVALFEADELIGVYPHSWPQETYTVEEAVATLRAGDVPAPLSAAGRRPPEAHECPACEAPLDTGGGLYACVRCEWTGIRTNDGQLEPVSTDEETVATEDLAPEATRD